MEVTASNLRANRRDALESTGPEIAQRQGDRAQIIKK